MLTTIALTRSLGATEYGIYALIIAWLGLLNRPTSLGLDKLLVREVAAYQTKAMPGFARGLLRRADQVSLLVSLSLGVSVALVVLGIETRSGSSIYPAFLVALLLLPVNALMRVKGATLRGLHHIIAPQLLTKLIQPMLFLALIVGAHFLLFQFDLTASTIIWMRLSAFAAVLVLATVLLHRTLPQTVKQASPRYQSRAWTLSALPILLVGSLQVVNGQIDTIMLGAMTGTEAAGMYTVANRGAGLIPFVLGAVNITIAPTIASLYAAQNLKRLQSIITRSTRIVFILSLPAAIVLIVFGQWFLMIFGPEFVVAGGALTLLSIGQLINAAAGSVAILLIMTGHERFAAIGVGIGLLVNVILNFSLIPDFGIEGAAIARVSSQIIWNVLMVVYVYKRLGIHSTALGRISILQRK